MGSLAILADDLTGALDTAAPFATLGEAVRVSWRPDALASDARVAFDTESRDIAAGVAASRVAAALARLGTSEVSFKKLDSLMRGNTVVEAAACAGSGAFRSVVIAPAFPEEGRITRCGTQIVPGRDGAPSVAADIAAGLGRHGVAVRLVRRGADLPERGVALCDAETPEDLAAIAAQGATLTGPLLWCGAAGLARALGRRQRLAAALDGPRLFVVGSRHPVAVGQAERLRARLGSAAATVTGETDPAAAIAPATRALAEGRCAAVVFALPDMPGARAEAIMAAAFAALAVTPPPAVLVVVGGDTVFRLCRALGAASLLALGEWAPGVPLAQIAGGAWDGIRTVTKSGAFADRDVLLRLLEQPSKDQHA